MRPSLVGWRPSLLGWRSSLLVEACQDAKPQEKQVEENTEASASRLEAMALRLEVIALSRSVPGCKATKERSRREN